MADEIARSELEFIMHGRYFEHVSKELIVLEVEKLY